MTKKEEIYYQLSELLDEIDAIFMSSGYDVKDFDEDELEEYDDEVLQSYRHICRFKAEVEI